MIAQIDKTTKEARYFDIRRMTPREEYRLMGVADADIDLLMATRLRGGWKQEQQLCLFGAEEWDGMLAEEIEVPVLSATEHYKLAGNSIVVDVLTAIFRQMFRPGLLNGDASCWNYRHPADRPIKVFTLCAGYDSQCLALQRLCDQLAIDESEPPLAYQLIGWSECDPESSAPLNEQSAVIAHNLLFPEAADLNYGDMTTIDWQTVVPSKIRRGELDLLTYSTPCTDISQAGKQAGIARDSGTRSAVLWHTEKAIAALHPRFLLQENVAALVSKKVMPHFKEWLDTVERLGYRNYWAVLNSKRFGVPQHRERLFCVSVRNDICPEAVFAWPSPLAIHRVIEDIMETDCDQRFFLQPELVIAFLRKQENPDRPQCYTVCDRKLTSEEIAEFVSQSSKSPQSV